VRPFLSSKEKEVKDSEERGEIKEQNPWAGKRIPESRNV
jgi:beta-lactam-binding protein with PASTA domain